MADKSWRMFAAVLVALCAGGCAGMEGSQKETLTGLLPKAAARWNEPLRLTARASGAIEGDFHQPTGRLLFVSGMEGMPRLWLQEDAPLGLELPQLLSLHSGRDAWPRISPDGRRVLLVSGREDAAGDIWLIELDSRPSTVVQILSGGGMLPMLVRRAEPRSLTGPDSADDQPCWHPHGRRIFFASAPSVQDRYELFEMDLRSGDKTCLTTDGGQMPDCSPDGSYLTFASNTGGKNVSIHTMRLADRAVVRLTDGPIDIVPCWSEDGGSVYFVRHGLDTDRNGVVDRDDASAVFSVTFEPRIFDDKRLPPARQLTSWEFNATAPRRVPGGFLFSSNRGRSGQGKAPFNLWALPACGEVPDAEGVRSFMWFAGAEQSRARENNWRLLLAWQNALWAAREAAYSGRIQYDLAKWGDVAQAALEMADHLSALGYPDAARARLESVLAEFPASQAYCGLARVRLLELERPGLAGLRPEEAAPRWEEHLKQSRFLARDFAERARAAEEKLSRGDILLLEAVAARAQLEVGLSLRGSKQYPAALDELKKVTDDYPRQRTVCAQALLARAEVFRVFQQPEAAQGALLALLRRYGDVRAEANRAAELIVDEIAKAAEPGRALQQKVSELRALIEKYRYEPVLPAMAQNRIGDLFVQARDYHQAREAYRQTIDNFTSAAEQVGAAYLALAAVDIRQNDYTGAAAVYAELLNWLQLRECAPGLSRSAVEGYINAMLLKARAESDAGDVKLALTTHSELANFDPTLAEAHRGLVDCLAKLGRTDEAILRYRPLVEADPRDDVSHFALARAYSYYGPTDWSVTAADRSRRAEIDREALRLLNRAILVRHDVPYYHQLRGFLFNRIAVATGDDDARLQALEAYISALGLSDPERDPANHAALLFDVAEGYMLVGQEENAHQYYGEALKAGFPLDGARGEAALENMSRSARAAGDYEAAAKLLQQLLARLPRDLPADEKERTALLVRRARILDQLALSCYLDGRYAEAADTYASTIRAIQDLMARHSAERDRYVRNLVRAQRNQAVNIYQAVEKGTLDMRQLERAHALLVESVQQVEEVGIVETGREAPGLFTIDIELVTGKKAGAAEFDLGAEKRLLYTYLARISALAGDYRQAGSFIEKKLSLYPRAGRAVRPDRLSELAVVQSQLGQYRVEAGDLPGAAKAFEEAMELERQALNLEGETADCYSLGRTALRLASLTAGQRGMTDREFASWLDGLVRRHKELLRKCEQGGAAYLAEDVAMLNANLAELVPLLERTAPAQK